MIHKLDLTTFHESLLGWWEKNQRKYPWRSSHNPYHILISEIMLHRTRADQVVPVYISFIRTFPTIQDLAEAKLDEVKKILHKLGLFWRNELLFKMAQDIVTRYKGEIPSARKDLESLPGVSQYIASTVRCFAFGHPEPLLDTNTVRILGRVFGIRLTDSCRRSLRFRRLYQSLMNTAHPRDFNYAMIDLGALVCTPKNPECDICPLNSICSYGKTRLGVIG
jgi:A/G-specific adenine glycosylase